MTEPCTIRTEPSTSSRWPPSWPGFIPRRCVSTSARAWWPLPAPEGSRRYSRSDIDQLLRIQELTNEGLNLLGVQRVLQLENDLANARAELETQRQESLRKIEALRQEAEGHLRAQRRDLVPLRQEVVLYRDVRPGSTRRG